MSATQLPQRLVDVGGRFVRCYLSDTAPQLTTCTRKRIKAQSYLWRTGTELWQYFDHRMDPNWNRIWEPRCRRLATSASGPVRIIVSICPLSFCLGIWESIGCSETSSANVRVWHHDTILYTIAIRYAHTYDIARDPHSRDEPRPPPATPSQAHKQPCPYFFLP